MRQLPHWHRTGHRGQPVPLCGRRECRRLRSQPRQVQRLGLRAQLEVVAVAVGFVGNLGDHPVRRGAHRRAVRSGVIGAFVIAPPLQDRMKPVSEPVKAIKPVPY